MEEIHIQCPYCLQAISILLDTGIYEPATIVEESWCKDPILKEIAKTEGGSVEALGTICMYTTNAHGRKAILTGWLASQSDILSNDWIILK